MKPHGLVDTACLSRALGCLAHAYLFSVFFTEIRIALKARQSDEAVSVFMRVSRSEWHE
jgi:hypothetical protein